MYTRKYNHSEGETCGNLNIILQMDNENSMDGICEQWRRLRKKNENMKD